MSATTCAMFNDRHDDRLQQIMKAPMRLSQMLNGSIVNACCQVLQAHIFQVVAADDPGCRCPGRERS